MVSLGLLETVTDGMFGVFCFNDGQDDATHGHQVIVWFDYLR